MSLTILPLSKPAFDTETFLRVYRQIYKKSAAQELDNIGIKPDSPLGTINLLGNLNDYNSMIYQHLTYSFLAISLYNIAELMTYSTELHIITRMENNIFLSVISGNLLEWKITMEDYLNDSFSPLIRAVLTKCLQEFEKDGLGVLWSDFSKQSQSDGTLILRPR